MSAEQMPVTGDPDLDRCEAGCRCPRCGRDSANVYSDGIGCWDCNAELEAMFSEGGIDG